MVAVPPYAARDVQRDLLRKQKHRRNFVGHNLGGMKMPVVEQANRVVLRGVIQVKLVRADCERFHTDAKHLRFHGVNQITVVDFFGKNLVERLF
ncbi:hypothetical protein SDC9_166813 [bioreactor metagenome]|uniref:Uncharacterized protein n=1 Tax=bioreactor metagenome TaxID=1076179 RepID=A0A645G5M8_9ZZZZ